MSDVMDQVRSRNPEDNAVDIAMSRRDASGPEAAQFPENVGPPEVEGVKAWELIDAEVGRYMPRRIRGSFRGRALG